MIERHAVPTFYLYGEPHRLVEESFVHVEALDDRSRPSEWTISPHAHTELCHVFLIASGGGRMQADELAMHFTAPCLLIVPAATAHGFVWHEESTGTVVTMATRYVDELARRDPALPRIFDAAYALALSAEDHAVALHLTAKLMRELAWSAPGHRAAVDAAILSLLVTALRHPALRDRAPAAAPGYYPGIVARLRERIEQRFRLREGVASHAAALGVSETALRVACTRVAGLSPSRMLDQRALLEARRALLYSNLSVAEIGYALGFADPAYFSRFFTRHSGQSPGRFRAGGGRPPEGQARTTR